MDYNTFLGDCYDEKNGEFRHDEAKSKATAEKGKCNIFICGASGVGKSSLINTIFGEEIVKAGVGKPITKHLEKIDIPEKGICLWDTKGIEAEDYKNTMELLEKEFNKELDSAKDAHDLPHIGWVCIKASSDRVEERDLQLIAMLQKRNIPTIVVFTRTIGKTEKNFIEKAKEIIDEKYKDFLQGSYIPVNSVPYEISDDYTVEIQGIDLLIEVSEKRFPEGKKSAKNAFLQAQRINIEKRFKAMKEEAQKAVSTASIAAGTAGASPIPGSDAPIIAAIQSVMIYKINSEFQLDSSQSNTTSIITGIMGVTALAQVGKAVVSNIMKFIPGAGSLIGGAISAATAAGITTAVGNTYISVLEKFYCNKKGKVILPQNTDTFLKIFSETFKQKN